MYSPVFVTLFIDCPKHVSIAPESYFHSGSSCQLFTKPMAAGSTIGYFTKRALMSAVNVFCKSIASYQYAIQHNCA